MVKITNTNLIKFDNRHGVEAIERNKIRFWFNGNKYTIEAVEEAWGNEYDILEEKIFNDKVQYDEEDLFDFIECKEVIEDFLKGRYTTYARV